MIATVDVCIEAANPSMPLFPMRAFVDSPSSARIRNVPKKIGNWQINSVQFTVKYPDESIKTAECKLVGGVWVGTVEGCSTAGFSQNGYTIFASGIDENGNAVNDYILGKGDVTIIDAGGIVTPTTTTTYVHLLSAMPAAPKDGDVWPSGNTYFIYQNNAAHQLGGLLSSDIDATLKIAGKAADAKAAGDGIDEAMGQVTHALVELSYVQEKIPAQASEQNQLADKAFVNSSVQTATANFRGNWATWADVPTDANDYPEDYAGSKTPTTNDYMVVQDASGLSSVYEGTWRFKYTGVWTTSGKNGWEAEYQVNETPMTAAQLAAINSGITSALVQTFSDAATDSVKYIADTKGNKTAVALANRGSGNVGIRSFTAGNNAVASSPDSIALGANAQATGLVSPTAIGQAAVASQMFSTAIGTQTTASGIGALALGYGATASGGTSLAIGCYETSATGSYSVALGAKINADDTNAFGWNGASSGIYQTKGVGTFCINPQGGLSGVYIGDENLNDIVADIPNKMPLYKFDIRTEQEVDDNVQKLTLRPFTNSQLTIGANDCTLSIAPYSDPNVARDLTFTVTQGQYGCNFTWPTSAFIPADNDQSNLSAELNADTVFFITEFKPNKFLVSRQVVENS